MALEGGEGSASLTGNMHYAPADWSIVAKCYDADIIKQVVAWYHSRRYLWMDQTMHVFILCLL
jgi:hypothetical protein